MENFNKLFYIGVSISCSGLVMLFTYFVGNELLKQTSGVIEFLYLNPLLLIIAGLIFLVGFVIVILTWDKTSR